jgi:hypothetical protein
MAGSYELNVSWGARANSASDCAECLGNVLRELAAIDPIFSNWKTVGDKGVKRCVLSPEDAVGLLRAVEEGRSTHEFGELGQDLGFLIGAGNGRNTIFSVGLLASLGSSTMVSGLCNNICLVVGLPLQTEPTIVTLPVFKPALVALARICDAGWGTIAPTRSTDFGQIKPNPLRQEIWSGWVVYLSAALAARITPPRSAIVEEVPGGGMLMIATEETFEPDNSEHFRVACDIQAALAPLNALPWPPDLSVARNL